jgi:divinyl protochlorophyllide a 8-vinyl-reductase
MAEVAQGFSGAQARAAAGAAAPALNVAPASGVIGPNAVIQLAAALDAAHGRAVTKRLFAAAGAGDLLAEPPGRMVDEARVRRLYEVLEGMLPVGDAMAVAYDAGRRTADYVRVNRIPKIARALIRWLPRRLAARVLVKAIVAHAWTFAGSGWVRAAVGGRTVLIEITDNPLRTREGSWHCGVLEGLFGALVSPDAKVNWCAVQCGGRPVCRFEIDIARA